MTAYLWLAFAIVCEIAATSLLKYAALAPSLAAIAGVIVGYGAAFFALALALRDLGVGEAYALWSAAGTLGIFLIGAFFFGEAMSLLKILGAALIVLGIILVKAA